MLNLMTVLLFFAFSSYVAYCCCSFLSTNRPNLIKFIPVTYYSTWGTAIACLYFGIQTNTSLSVLLLSASLAGLTTLTVGFILQSNKLKAIGLPLFWQLGLLVLLRVFGWESFQIPSLSMYPNLNVGDYVVVNKHAYQIKFPELNWEFHRLASPKRGEVVVFYSPETPTLPLIKRVVAIAGDDIRISNNKIFVNGKPYHRDITAQLNIGDLFQETNLDGAAYSILIAPSVHNRRNSSQWVVPTNHIFVMGDNRSNSRDSRYYGFVPLTLLLGRAEYIWMHWPKILSLPSLDRNTSLVPTESE